MESIRDRKLQFPKFGLGVYAVIYRNFNSFLRNWKQISFEFVLQPLLYIASFGFFMKKIIVAPGVDNYASFLFYGLFFATCFSTCFFEANLGIKNRLMARKSRYSISIAPVEYSEIVLGEYLWCVFVSVVTSSIFLLSGVLLGLITILQMFPLLLTSLFLALITSAIAFWLNSGILDKINISNPMLLIVLPFFLFSGVFYPTAFLNKFAAMALDTLPLGFAIRLSREQGFAFTAKDIVLFLVYIVIGFLLLSWSNSRLHHQLIADIDAKEED